MTGNALQTAERHWGFQICSLYWSSSVTVANMHEANTACFVSTNASLFITWCYQLRNNIRYTTTSLLCLSLCNCTSDRESDASLWLTGDDVWHWALFCRCAARASQRSSSVWVYSMLWIKTRTSQTNWPSSSENHASSWLKASKRTSPRYRARCQELS